MNRHTRLFGIMIFLIVPVIFAQNNFAQDKKNSAQHYNIFDMYYQKQVIKDKDRDKKEEEKFDEPNMFAQFEHDIRTRDGERVPGYPVNYLMDEFTKSQERSRLYKTNAYSWTERGPGNVSGRTRGIIVDLFDTSNKTWFAGSVSGGIWKTTNTGAAWVNKTPNMPNLATTVLAQSTHNLNVIYCGTGEGFNNVDAVNGAGIFKSTDHGETWAQLSSTVNFQTINRIIIDPSNENTVLACTNSGTVQRSTNGGTTWSQANFNKSNLNRIQDLKADPNNFLIQYCAVNNDGVYKSTDGGINWTKTGSLSTNGRIEIAVSNNYIYANAQTSSGSGLYMSEDKGATWLQVKSSDGKTYDWLGGQGWYDNVIAVQPDNETIVFFGGIDLWKAVIQNAGTTATTRTALFSHVTDGYGNYQTQSPKPSYVHVDHHNITLVPLLLSPGTFWIVNGNDGGISYSTNNGLTWNGNSTNTKGSNGGYNTTQFYGVDKKPGTNEFIGGTQDNGTWISPSGQNASASSIYTSPIGGDGFGVAWNYNDPNKVIGGSQYNSFYRTTDGGNSWVPATNGLADVGSGKGVFISRIAKSNSDPDILFTTGSQGIWRSEDFGASWSLSSITQKKGWSYGPTSTPIAVSIANPQVVWAGNRFANSDSRLFVSKDGGVTFDSVYKPTGIIAPGSITGISTHPTEMNTAFVTYSFSGGPKIIRTTDLGVTWTDISGFGFGSTSTNGFPDVATYCVLVMPFNTNIIWAGTEIGLVESINNGATWHLANNGLPAVSIWEMKIVDDQIVLATHGRGIFSVTLSQVSGGSYSNYTPPVVTLPPIITGLSQGVDGKITLVANLRSAYDSTQVMINGQPQIKINASPAEQQTFNITPTVYGQVTMQLISYVSGIKYKSSNRVLNVYNLKPAQVVYTTNFDAAVDDFASTGFTVSKPSGFTSPAVNSPHPYVESTDYYYNLLVPIRISSSTQYATIAYDDVALVEPGDPGSKFSDSNFYDYVAVEGSKDGLNWTPIADGYDCRYTAAWTSLFNSNTNPTSASFVHHTIQMTTKFSSGDVVFIRFHLYSDEAAVGWGWIFDNLSIQPGAPDDVKEDNSLPAQYSLSQNYPNPFNPETTIKFSLPRHSKVKLEIFDAIGRVVSTLVDSELDAGTYRYNWNGSQFASGVYFYRIRANDFSSSKKLMLVK